MRAQELSQHGPLLISEEIWALSGSGPCNPAFLLKKQISSWLSFSVTQGCPAMERRPQDQDQHPHSLEKHPRCSVYQRGKMRRATWTPLPPPRPRPRLPIGRSVLPRLCLHSWSDLIFKRIWIRQEQEGCRSFWKQQIFSLPSQG